MSESYGGGAYVPASGEHQSSGTVETATQEAGQVAETAKAEAGHVVETAKTEASAVAGEAKSQVKDLYAQTQQELKDQAAIQQRRVAESLRSVGEELDSLARNAPEPGIATDLVRQASERVSGIASWIGDRDPGSLLAEVKSYARRRPGVFIAAAALAGLAAGRLTRALAENAAEDSSAASTGASTGSGAPVPGRATSDGGPAPDGVAGVGATGVVPPLGGDAGSETSTPVYEQSRAAWEGTAPDDGVR